MSDTEVNERYRVLFEPVEIGPVTAKNRFFAVAHSAGMGYDQPHATAAMRGMKAEGGWGVVCTGVCEIDATSDMMGHHNDRLWDDHDVECHRLTTDAIHKHDALAAVELAHLGLGVRNLYSRIPPLGPVSMKCTSTYVPVQSRAMTLEDIANFRASHRAAVRRAIAAGYDIIYVYAAHDRALPLHFLSRKYNQRTDEYGGSFENRLRLLRELIEDTKSEANGRCAVAVRFAVHDFTGVISKDEEGRAVIEALADLPDLWDVNVSPWSFDSSTARFDPEGWQEPYISFVKKLTRKPVVGVGRFTSADAMVAQIKRGVVDFIGAARPSIADPFIPEKIRAGRIDEIRECIGCNMCASMEMYGVAIRCTQNAVIGEEWRRGWHPERIAPVRARETALIVGAGPAGLEAALTLARGGWEVSLVEAQSQLGGRLLWESQLPGSKTLIRVRDYRAYQLERMANVRVFRDSPLSAEDVIEYGANRVIIATGSTWRSDGVGPVTPAGLPGLNEQTSDGFVFSPEEIVHQIVQGLQLNGRAVIYDDDHYYVGHEIAELLRARGLEVVLVTPLAEISQWSYYTLEMRRLDARLAKAGIQTMTRTRVVALERGRVRLKGIDTESWVDARCFIPVTLRAANQRLFEELKGREAEWRDAGIRSIDCIGDAVAPGTVAAAVYAGAQIARGLGEEGGATAFRRERIQLLETT